MHHSNASRVSRSRRALVGTLCALSMSVLGGCVGAGDADDEEVASSADALVAPDMGMIFVSREELGAKPTSGAGWTFLKSKADMASFGTPTLADQDSLTQSYVLAAALVYARTGDAAYKNKVLAYVKKVPGTERGTGARVLSVARTLYGYVVSANLVGMSLDTPCENGQTWREFLSTIRTKDIGGHTRWTTLELTAGDTATNWGTYALSTHLAVSYALRDGAAVKRDTDIFRRYLGDRSSPAPAFKPSAGYAYNDNGASWDMLRTLQVGINPSSATDGRAGAMIEDILRDPDAPSRSCCTPSSSGITYSEESMDAALSTAMLLRANGVDVRSVGDSALKRTHQYVVTHGGPGPYSLSRVLPYAVNYWYGTSYPTRTEDRPYRHLGYGSWLFTGTAPTTTTTADAGTSSPPPASSEAPALRGTSSAPGGSLTALDVDRPSGTTAGDLLVAAIVYRGSGAITPPAGFTLALDTIKTGTHVSTFLKKATATEPAAYRFTVPVAAGLSGGLTAWQNASGVEASAGAIGTDASVEVPSVTTAGADRVVLAVYAQVGAVTYTPPSGSNEHFDVQTPSGAYLASVSQSSRAQATAGASGVRTAIASGTGGGWLAQSLAIR